jgi:serpin B
MLRPTYFTIFAAAIVFLSACSSPAEKAKAKAAALTAQFPATVCTDTSNIALDSSQTAIGIADIAQANNRLGLNMMKALAKSDADKNIFISPYSVSMAFAMLYLGSAGATSEEIAQTLGWKQNSAALHRALFQLSEQLRSGASDTTYTLGIANRIWANKADLCLRRDYQKQATDIYNAPPLGIDFGDLPAAIKIINDWASDNTNGKIKDLYSPTALNKETKIVLANAVYFKADWLDAFEKKNTQQADFFAAQTLKADFMHTQIDKNDALKHFDEPTFNALALPYKGKQLSMYILLPKENTPLDTLISQLTDTTLQKILTENGEFFNEANIKLPKWTVNYDVEMSEELLPALGMTNIFKSADLNRMTTVKNLYVSSVVHKTFIAVDEKGTEAAAVTSIAVTTESANIKRVKIINFHANRPFLYFIADNKSGTILFVGNMLKP